MNLNKKKKKIWQNYFFVVFLHPKFQDIGIYNTII